MRKKEKERDGGRHLQGWRVGSTPCNYLHPFCQPQPAERTDTDERLYKRDTYMVIRTSKTEQKKKNQEQINQRTRLTNKLHLFYKEVVTP